MARLTLNGMYQYDPTLFEGMVLPTGYDSDALLSEIMKRSGQLYPYHQVPHILKADIRLWFSRNYLNFDRMMDALTAEYNPIENYNRIEAWTRTPNLTDKSTLSGKDSMAASGKDSVQASGDDVTKHTGTDSDERTYTNFKEIIDYKGTDTRETQVSAFDSSIYQPSEQVTDSRTNRQDEKTTSGSYKDSTTHGHTETLTNGRKDETTYGRKDETTYGKVDTVTHNGTESYRSNIHGNIGVTTNQQMIEAELEMRKFDIYSEIAARFEHEFIVQVY